ncbi:MAG: helix-turn-helix domain-containing protein, partial [Clostridia bacterium]|nr:helix-turn-helix domain-containing protein [Clostridia bacterium]
SATPTAVARTLPFYVSEAGHFMADSDYLTSRETHDSFLLLYTLSGEGSVQTGETVITLAHNYAVIIDCHSPHEYKSISENWEFIWIHFGGSGVTPMYDVTYPSGAVCAASMENAPEFEEQLNSIIEDARQNDIEGYIHLSSHMHSIFNAVCLAVLENDKVSIKHNSANDVREVVRFIEKNYFNPITVDDMIENIHVSKYHFIRRFKRAMGTSPYSYLTNYRINKSKTLLRTTSMSVSEIAEICGFMDTSNFISHFKKHTGQKPLGYRRDFSL